jgi:hypothetical protein
MHVSALVQVTPQPPQFAVSLLKSGQNGAFGPEQTLAVLPPHCA